MSRRTPGSSIGLGGPARAPPLQLAKEPPLSSRTIMVNRAPVLTLWAAVVAERLGHDHAAALTLGKAVAGLNAQSKGRRLGLFEAPKPGTRPKKVEPGKPARTIPLLGRAVPVSRTPKGIRAVVKGRAEDPAGVERYLGQKFGPALEEARSAMRALARSLPPRRLEEEAFALYEKFRPKIPEGVKGWGAKGVLDLGRLRTLARRPD